MSSSAAQALRIAREQLAAQKADLIALRSQAIISATISGLIMNGFILILSGVGGFDRDFEWGAVSISAIIAILLLSTSVGLAIRVAAGFRTFTFDQSANWIIEKSENYSEKKIDESLAIEAEEFFDRNESGIANIQGVLSLSLISGWAQIPFWLIAIYGSLK